MKTTSLLVALLPLTQAIRIVVSNDDGWAEVNVRTLFNTLSAAGQQVILSGPAEGKSGTGNISPSLSHSLHSTSTLVESHTNKCYRLFRRNTNKSRLRWLHLPLLSAKQPRDWSECNRSKVELRQLLPCDQHQKWNRRHCSCALGWTEAATSCHRTKCWW